jgi:hypothetical protein
VEQNCVIVFVSSGDVGNLKNGHLIQANLRVVDYGPVRTTQISIPLSKLATWRPHETNINAVYVSIKTD